MNLRPTLAVVAVAAAVLMPRPADAVDPRGSRTPAARQISNNSSYGSPRFDGQGRQSFNQRQSGYGLQVDPTYGYDPFLQPVSTAPQPSGVLAPTFNDTPVAAPGRGRGVASNQFADPSLNPNAPQTEKKRNRWRLGVRSQDTDHGVRIMRVLDGSPAFIANLEPDDVIVAVGGYQVGTVNGERFDLGTEFDIRCDENGTTNLLVQNNRDRSLVNIPVQLEPRFSTVTGEIVWRSERSLPRESYALVELREIVRPGAPPITIGEKVVHGLRDAQTTKTGRVPFEIEFDPADIDSRRRYVVFSAITDGQHTLYHTEEMYPVITGPDPRRVVTVNLNQTWNWDGRQQAGRGGSSDEWEQFATLFKKYMGRPLRPGEQMVYRNDFERGATLNEKLVDVVGGTEFYQRCNGDDRNFITQAFMLRTGRQPNQQEMQYWLAKLGEFDNMHRPFSRELLTQLN